LLIRKGREEGRKEGSEVFFSNCSSRDENFAMLMYKGIWKASLLRIE
jgi:hypothetical protein